MPWLDVIWTDENTTHLAEHGVIADEAEQVLQEPDARTRSASSDRPIAVGYTSAGRYLVVVYEQIDDLTVYPITAYPIED
jgi:uncharacterized DUF497 family protein